MKKANGAHFFAEEKAQASVGMFLEQKQAPDGFRMCITFK